MRRGRPVGSLFFGGEGGGASAASTVFRAASARRGGDAASAPPPPSLAASLSRSAALTPDTGSPRARSNSLRSATVLPA